MTATIIPFPGTTPTEAPPAEPTAPAECAAPPKRRKRAALRTEQHVVCCTRVPRKQHRDLRDLSGVLTLDFKGETPWTATFDPDDHAVPNIVAPITAMKCRDDDTWEITTDEGTWAFATPDPDDSDDDSDDDEEE